MSVTIQPAALAETVEKHLKTFLRLHEKKSPDLARLMNGLLEYRNEGIYLNISQRPDPGHQRFAHVIESGPICGAFFHMTQGGRLTWNSVYDVTHEWVNSDTDWTNYANSEILFVLVRIYMCLSIRKACIDFELTTDTMMSIIESVMHNMALVQDIKK